MGTGSRRYDESLHRRALLQERRAKMATDFTNTQSGDIGKKVLPSEAQERKKYPIATGVLDCFPAALAEIAKVSLHGNRQHNPGEPLHWARLKSTDQADTVIRHFLERGSFDSDGIRHTAKLAWLALALLHLELEDDG